MKRNHNIEIRLSKEELEKIKRNSQELGMTISAYIRMIALKSKISIETLTD